MQVEQLLCPATIVSGLIFSIMQPHSLSGTTGYSPKRLAKLVTELYVIGETCEQYFFVNRKLAKAKHDELVNWAFDETDSLLFMRFLSEEMSAAAEDFVGRRIDKNWCEGAKSNLIEVFPAIFEK
jgi:hypothetical protein